MSEFTGKIQGLHMAIQAFQCPSDASSVTKADVERVVTLLERQIDMTEQSLRVGDSGLMEASRQTGTTMIKPGSSLEALEVMFDLGLTCHR